MTRILIHPLPVFFFFFFKKENRTSTHQRRLPMCKIKTGSTLIMHVLKTPKSKRDYDSHGMCSVAERWQEFSAEECRNPSPSQPPPLQSNSLGLPVPDDRDLSCSDIISDMSLLYESTMAHNSPASY